MLIAGCGGGGSTTETGTPGPTPTEQSRSGVGLRKIGEFDQPVYIAQPPEDGDLYVVEKAGRLRIIRDGGTVAKPALDITDEVADFGEEGLLSVAFPPDFQSSRLLYLYFTGNSGGDEKVVEYRANGDGMVDRASARAVLDMPDFASNHNGGSLVFGPDGELYIGTGDGGLEGDPRRTGQDLQSLLGKILRINPRPSDSRPYTVSSPGPLGVNARPEICDYGLRNPWRFSFDRGTGALLIGDVGWSSEEEIDYRPAELVCGNNFGWSAFEGDQRLNRDQEAPGAIAPILTYSHEDGACSVTGGYVARDPTLPSLQGRYVYGDYCTGELRSLEPAAPSARDDRPLGLQVPSLSSFGQDNAGHLYAVSLNGPVYRLVAQ